MSPSGNTAVFDGRARRKEFWLFTLFNLMVSVALGVAQGAGIVSKSSADVLGGVYQLAILLPSIAVGVRRMHDTGHSGWWILLPIVNVAFWVRDSQPGVNQYGSNPKFA